MRITEFVLNLSDYNNAFITSNFKSKIRESGLCGKNSDYLLGRENVTYFLYHVQAHAFKLSKSQSN